MVCASSWEAETDVSSLTDSEEETIVLAVELNKPLVAETHSGQSYLKKYDEMVASPPKPTTESAKPRSNWWRSRKSFDSKALPKDNAEGSTTPYRFDILAQLANIPARITLYALETIKVNKRSSEGSPN